MTECVSQSKEIRCVQNGKQSSKTRLLQALKNALSFPRSRKTDTTNSEHCSHVVRLTSDVSRLDTLMLCRRCLEVRSSVNELVGAWEYIGKVACNL